MADPTARTLLLAACLLAATLPSWATASPEPAMSDAEAEIERCMALRRKEPGAAADLADSILATAALDREDRIKTLACLGMGAAIAGQPMRATAAVDRLEAELALEAMAPEFEVRALSNAGSILHIAGQVRRALDFYVRAYEAASAEDAVETQVVTLTNIGIIHDTELHAYEEAEAFYRRALALSRTLDTEGGFLHYNYARNLQRFGRGDEALSFLDEAVALAGDSGNRVLGYRAEAERIALLGRRGEEEDAESRLAGIADLQRALPDLGGASTTMVRLSELALARGDAKAALAHAQAASALVPDDGPHRGRIEALDAELAAERALGHVERALELSMRQRDLQVSALRAQNIESLAGLQARLQDADRAREVERLREQGLLQSARLDTTRLLRNWAIGSFLLLALATIAFALYQRRVNRRLRQMGEVDALTGLLNRGAASRRLSEGLPDGERAGDRRGVLFIVDADRFKQTNDRHGHAAGDAILVEIAARLKRCCRPGDIVARWGGEEFLVACPRLDLAGAVAVAERIRAGVGESPIEVSQHARHTATVSVGFACWPFFPETGPPSRNDWAEAVRIADRALYAAKRSGRDAWVGLWGLAVPAVPVDAVLDDPARYVESGGIEARSSRTPIRW